MTRAQGELIELGGGGGGKGKIDRIIKLFIILMNENSEGRTKKHNNQPPRHAQAASRRDLLTAMGSS